MLGMFYWADRRDEARIRRIEARMYKLFRADEAQFREQQAEPEARQDEKFEELGQQVRDVNDRIGNVERGQSRLEGQLDVIRDALFQRSPG